MHTILTEKKHKRKGRPRKITELIDHGTKALQYKIQKLLTTEPIDLLVSYNFINEDMHSAALRLRWLYTIVNGSPSLTTYHKSLEQYIQKQYDQEWCNKRHKEYQEIINILQKAKSLKLILDVVIFNRYPLSIQYKFKLRKHNSLYDKLPALYEMQKITNGLEELVKFFSHNSIYNKIQ